MKEATNLVIAGLCKYLLTREVPHHFKKRNGAMNVSIDEHALL